MGTPYFILRPWYKFDSKKKNSPILGKVSNFWQFLRLMMIFLTFQKNTSKFSYSRDDNVYKYSQKHYIYEILIITGVHFVILCFISNFLTSTLSFNRSKKSDIWTCHLWHRDLLQHSSCPNCLLTSRRIHRYIMLIDS